MRIAVLGDASGWLSPTLAALRGLGVQVDLDRFSWPDDLIVVHVGDLVHKGPDGDDLVAWVDAVMGRVGDRWIQLLGNHEASYLGGAVFGADYGCWDLRPETIACLRRWLVDGRVRLAAALQDATGEERLVTHAGLTGGTWDDLGTPAGAPLIARHLNSMLALDPRRAFRSGEMLHHPAEPGVVWASEGELCRSWDGRAMPCSQIRGHTNPYDFSRQGWRSALPPEVRRAASAATTAADEEARHLRLPLGGRTVLCVDPGFSSRRPRHRLAPLVIDGEILPDAPPSGWPEQPLAWDSPVRNHEACNSSWDWPVPLEGLSYEDETVSFAPVSWERLEVLLSGNRPQAQAVQAGPQVQDVPLVESRPERNASRRGKPERRHGRRRWWSKSC
ncbi:MAG: metallophosphoesterase [Actinomycetota bacterium]